MTMKFDKNALLEACDVIHRELNVNVLDATQAAWGAFSGIDDDNPQKSEMKTAISDYQDTYNSLTELFNKMLAQFGTVIELQGQLEKYETNSVKFIEAEGTIEEIDTTGIFA